MVSNESLNNLSKHYLKTTLSSTLLDTKISAPASEIFINNLLSTINDVKNELDISIPINYIVPGIWEWGVMFDNEAHKNTIAFFEPIIDNMGLTKAGKIYFNTIITRSQAIQLGNENKNTPWEAIRDLTHELRHAFQFENDTQASLDDGNNPYNAQFREYDADLYAYNFIKKQPSKNFVDWGNKQILLGEIRSKLKRIKNERKKLGLEK